MNSFHAVQLLDCLDLILELDPRPNHKAYETDDDPFQATVVAEHIKQAVDASLVNALIVSHDKSALII